MQIHKHELRLRMDAAIGRAPPLSDFELQVMLRCPAAQSWQLLRGFQSTGQRE